MKLMKIERFAKYYFEPGSSPDPRTIRRWIEKRVIPGVVLNGSIYYIDQEKWEALLIADGDLDIDALIEKVLANGATATH